MKRHPTCQGLTAKDELRLFRRSIRLLPALARRGVAPADALAVAYNATFLFHHLPHSPRLFSPRQVLRLYTLGEIAGMCESILGGAEWGVNKNYREDLP